jgi:hypothetical protein
MKTLSSILPFVLLLCVVLIKLVGCSSDDGPKPVDCNLSTLDLGVVAAIDPAGCNDSDGSISVSATGGTPPYLYSINNGPTGSISVFTGLGPGQFTVRVQDTDNCSRTVQVILEAEGSTLAASTVLETDDECLNDVGSITVNASGGVGPYEYRIGSQAFQSNSTFTLLRHGNYTVVVKDTEGCELTLNVNVPRGDTGTSYDTQIKPILTTRCALSGCHDGSSSLPNWTVLSNVQANAQNIKSRTTNRIMPPAGQTPLTDDQIALIACWVDDGAKNN